MSMKEVFRESADAHIRDLLDSIEHHEKHLESTETVSMETHLAALEKIGQKQETLETHLHGLRAAIDECVEGLKHTFNRVHD